MTESPSNRRRRIAVVTGTRAEYGLLRPVMRAIASHPSLNLRAVVTGTHLLGAEPTINEIKSEFKIAASFPMQELAGGGTLGGRLADARALGAGVHGMADFLARETPDVVVVLGDRIEAFAAAIAASVAGVRVAHIHGGDRAEGIADEAMRHAITKLAHIHLPATRNSALRIIAMGEHPQRVHIVGSPAIDGLEVIPPLDDSSFAAMGSPQFIMMLHPVGDSDEVEQDRAAQLIEIASKIAPLLIMHPNHDPGRDGIVSAIKSSGCRAIEHLPRERFIGLLRRATLLVGNSSAGLIEAAAIPLRCVNIGARQAGREMPGNVCDVPGWNYQTIREAIADALAAPRLDCREMTHPYGDGKAGCRIADVLAELDFDVHALRKQNAY